MLVNPNQPGVYRCKPASAPPRSCRPLFSPRWEPSSLPILPPVTQLKRLAACHPAQGVALVQLALFGQSRWLQSHLSRSQSILQVVHGALLPLAQPSSQVQLLARTFQPLLTRLSAHSWDCLQASSLWNLRRPVWLAALVRLLEPWLAPAVVDLLRSVEEGSTWTLSHLEKARKLLVTELAHLLQVVPPSLCHLLLRIDSQLPQNVNSLGGSACSHIIFATIYTSISNLLPELRKARVAREKIDFLIAFCENLCNLDIVADIGWVNQCLTSILQVLLEQLIKFPHTRLSIPFLFEEKKTLPRSGRT